LDFNITETTSFFVRNRGGRAESWPPDRDGTQRCPRQIVAEPPDNPAVREQR
jgi:hypothetical protein